MIELRAHGIDRLSIVDVARRAGVHDTTVYRRWPTKASLAISAILNVAEASLLAPDTGSLRDDLRELLTEIARFVQSPEGGLLLQLAAGKDLPEYAAAREYFDTERFTPGTAVLERAEQRGQIRHGLDHRLVMELLIGPLHVRALLTNGPLDDATIDTVVDLALAGVQA